MKTERAAKFQKNIKREMKVREDKEESKTNMRGREKEDAAGRKKRNKRWWGWRGQEAGLRSDKQEEEKMNAGKTEEEERLGGEKERKSGREKYMAKLP